MLAHRMAEENESCGSKKWWIWMKSWESINCSHHVFCVSICQYSFKFSLMRGWVLLENSKAILSWSIDATNGIELKGLNIVCDVQKFRKHDNRFCGVFAKVMEVDLYSNRSGILCRHYWRFQNLVKHPEIGPNTSDFDSNRQHGEFWQVDMCPKYSL